jgi:hypothetical protein
MRVFSLPVIVVLVSLAIGLPAAMRAQSQDASPQSSSQDSSVANAARRSHDKKKNPSNSSKSTKVITDDDLDRRNFQPGQEGLNVGASPMMETQPPSAKAVAAAEAADEASEQQALKDAAEQDSKLERLKLEITEAENGLDLAQRQLALDQDSFLSNPDHVHDAAGKAKLNDEKQDINDRQGKIEQLKSRVAALEELKSRRKTVRTQAAPPPQTENAPSAPPPSNPPQP